MKQSHFWTGLIALIAGIGVGTGIKRNPPPVTTPPAAASTTMPGDPAGPLHSTVGYPQQVGSFHQVWGISHSGQPCGSAYDTWAHARIVSSYNAKGVTVIDIPPQIVVPGSAPPTPCKGDATSADTTASKCSPTGAFGADGQLFAGVCAVTPTCKSLGDGMYAGASCKVPGA